jgi:8-oxo-dGTP pyrophosphatase MutT (NUDIX family)
MGRPDRPRSAAAETPDVGPRLPPGLAERARALARGELTPAEPRPAATVVLLRPHPAGVQAFLLRRVRGMAFAAGMHVFPGGSVDARDRDLPAERWAGLTPDTWSRILTADPPLARALVCAAVRETFEESGVLLAGPDVQSVVDDTRGPEWEADRAALVRHELAFSDLLERRRLRLRADLLRPWAHWITPEVEEHRYDTRFFVAAVPPGQRAAGRPGGGEADRASWLTPREALDRHRRGELGMMPPTVVTLAELAGFERVDDVLATADHRRVSPRLPTVVMEADEARLLLPHLDEDS